MTNDAVIYGTKPAGLHQCLSCGEVMEEAVQFHTHQQHYAYCQGDCHRHSCPETHQCGEVVPVPRKLGEDELHQVAETRRRLLASPQSGGDLSRQVLTVIADGQQLQGISDVIFAYHTDQDPAGMVTNRTLELTIVSPNSQPMLESAHHLGMIIPLQLQPQRELIYGLVIRYGRMMGTMTPNYEYVVRAVTRPGITSQPKQEKQQTLGQLYGMGK